MESSLRRRAGVVGRYLLVGALLSIGSLISLPQANAQSVRILSPAHGSTIQRTPDDPMPLSYTIEGDVLGFTKKELDDLGLRAHVSIRTTSVFPQGIAAVGPDGRWAVNGYFGDAVHRIRAVLVDRNGVERASATAVVTLVTTAPNTR